MDEQIPAVGWTPPEGPPPLQYGLSLPPPPSSAPVAGAGAHVTPGQLPPPPPPLPAHAYVPASGAGVAAGAAGDATRRRRTSGGAGALAAIAAALAKYGVFLLKFKYLAVTFFSMAVSFWFLGALFGWAFGAGLLVLIAVHESGHMLFAWAERLPVTTPIFLGPFGALIRTRANFVDRRQEAVVAIGGPVVGTMGAIVMYLAAMAQPTQSYAHGLLLALAYFGFFINLFNLVPFSPLDGGRVAGALTKWANVVGLVILVALFFGFLGLSLTPNPILFLILLIGGMSTYQRFKAARRGLEPPPLPARTRVWIGAAYLAMLAITAIGMSEAHHALAQLNYTGGFR